MFYWKYEAIPTSNGWNWDWFERNVNGQETKPNCEIGQTDTHYLLSVDLPGVAKQDIKVEALNDEITISAERKGHGIFERTFQVNATVDLEKIESLYQDGVLKIAIPKAESAKPRLVAIKSEDEGGFFTKLSSPKEEKAN